MQKHNDDTIKTSRHSSLEKYTSHFSRKSYERYYLWEVSWRLNRTATYWSPNSSGYKSISFPFSWAAKPGAWGPSLCWDMVLTPASSLQLIWLPVAPGLYNYLTPTCLLWASHLYSIQPVDSQGYCLISSTGCTCYLYRCISHLTAWPGQSQYVTFLLKQKFLKQIHWIHRWDPNKYSSSEKTRE